MVNFINEDYRKLVKDIVGDIYYSDASYRTKIKTIRQYAEVIVRKLLDYEPDKKLMLGNAKPELMGRVPNFNYVECSFDRIKDEGNDTTHTQERGEFTQNDFDDLADDLLNLLSLLMINYFDKYPFGNRNDVVAKFSILPPIYRYKVLVFLFSKDCSNRMIIDKLALATLKAKGKVAAMEWLNNNKDAFEQLPTYLDEEKNSLKNILGDMVAEKCYELIGNNMYEECINKINLLSDHINKQGTVYLDFESALPYYKTNGRIDDSADEIKEFNDIMDFLYLERKERI